MSINIEAQNPTKKSIPGLDIFFLYTANINKIQTPADMQMYLPVDITNRTCYGLILHQQAIKLNLVLLLCSQM